MFYFIYVLWTFVFNKRKNKSTNYEEFKNKYQSDTYKDNVNKSIGFKESKTLNKKVKIPDLEERIKIWRINEISQLNDFLSIEDILITKNFDEITYVHLLATFQWRFKRLKILIRDGFKCQKCGKPSKNNAVHHKYYIVQKFPWEYSFEALETLCHKCHALTHELNDIPVYRVYNYKLKETDSYSRKCYRCKGVGYFPEYTHVQNGICFECKGNTINYETFRKRIEIFLENSRGYNDVIEREKYRYYINKLAQSLIAEKVPYLKDININSSSFIMEEDDDLPF